MLEIAAIVLFAGVLAGCSSENSSFIDPQGPIAAAQRWHLIKVTGLTMIAVLPVLLLVPLLLWRYRYRNRSARYTPNWEFSAVLEVLMWGGPFLLIAIISTQLWRSTEDLDPFLPIASEHPPLQVQVVGLDWKWLFIYPEQGIASVGELAFPADRPVSLTLTTDTVMQSFMISSLAGQIYAMPGMTTRLNFKANAPGNFEGENTQFNGTGFAEQKFTAKALSGAAFDAWTHKVKTYGVPLNQKTYQILGKRGSRHTARAILGRNGMPPDVIYFSLAEPGMFMKIIHKYHSGEPVLPTEQPGTAGYLAGNAVPKSKQLKGDN